MCERSAPIRNDFPACDGPKKPTQAGRPAAAIDLGLGLHRDVFELFLHI